MGKGQFLFELLQKDDVIFQQIEVQHADLIVLENRATVFELIAVCLQEIDSVLAIPQQFLLLDQLVIPAMNPTDMQSCLLAHYYLMGFLLLLPLLILPLWLFGYHQKVDDTAVDQSGSLVYLREVIFEDRVLLQLQEAQPLFGIGCEYPQEQVLHILSAVLEDFVVRGFDCPEITKLLCLFHQLQPFSQFPGSLRLTSQGRQNCIVQQLTKGVLPVEHLVEQNPASPHIHLVAILPPKHDLRCFVWPSSQVGALDLLSRFAEPEISQFEHIFALFLLDKNILKLDVPVKIPLSMQVLQSNHYFRHDCDCLLQIDNFFGRSAHISSQVASLAVLQLQIDEVAIDESAIELNQVRIIHLLHALDLPLEIGHHPRILLQFLQRDEFEGKELLVLIFDQIDRPEASLSQQPLVLEPPENHSFYYPFLAQESQFPIRSSEASISKTTNSLFHRINSSQLYFSSEINPCSTLKTCAFWTYQWRSLPALFVLSYPLIIPHFPMSSRLSNIQTSLVEQEKSRLQLARESVSMCGEALKDLVFGADNFNSYVKPTIDFIDQNKHIFTQHNIEEHSLTEQRKEAARMTLALRKFWKIDMVNEPFQFSMITYAIAMYNGGMSTKSLLHYLLYSKSLILYQSNQLHKQLYERAMRGEDIGCFSLTEFHHGSFSKGIQTLAVFDKKSDQFVLTTQGTKGMKFWIGALSEVSNVTILWAQLVIDGKSEGPHPFYLPIRCPKTHRVLPGITIGDCGPKKGLNYIDNGYMMLENVNIPREYLLGKYGSVDEKGLYSSPIKSPNTRFGLHMSALSAGRANVAFTVNVLNPTTIALRYAHYRKQFQTPDKKDEIPIIDYPLTQTRLIPEISRTIVQLAAGVELSKIYCDKELFLDEVYLTEMHAISAAVKAKYTWATLKSSEECRTILGGHGYSSLSKIPSYIDDIEVNVTWEGDNNVLLQQTSKYLMKTIAKKNKTKVLNLDFVHEKTELNLQELEDNLRDMKTVELLVQDVLRMRYYSADSKMKELKSKYPDKETVDMHFHPQAGNALALSFADYFTFTIAKARINEAKNKEVKEYFTDCVFLWAFTLLEKQRYGSHEFRAAVQKQISALCAELVTRSVVATDALALPSHLIGSPFANPDGDGFKQYLSLLYSRKDAFTKAKHHERILYETSRN